MTDVPVPQPVPVIAPAPVVQPIPRTTAPPQPPAEVPKAKPAAPVSDPRAATFLRLGRNLEKRGNAQGAKEYFDRVQREFPDSAEAKALKAKE